MPPETSQTPRRTADACDVAGPAGTPAPYPAQAVHPGRQRTNRPTSRPAIDLAAAPRRPRNQPSRLLRRTMRAAARRSILAVAFALLALPAEARAGSYDVVTCNASGAGGLNHSWAPTYTALNQPPRPEMYDVYDDCSGARGQGGLVANSHNGNSEWGNAPFLTGGVWMFAAPAGTTITHITVWRHAF